MQDERSSSIPYEQRQRVEAAVLALLLAEDSLWRADELASRLSLPADAIGLAVATLQADGLLVSNGDKLRASWAAVRADELANRGSTRSNVEPACRVPGPR
ncbi:MAG: hypothetical protein ABSG93_19000 [Solirubrobacteraceae bacterium]|jgi:hypothetical protein